MMAASGGGGGRSEPRLTFADEGKGYGGMLTNDDMRFLPLFKRLV